MLGIVGKSKIAFVLVLAGPVAASSWCSWTLLSSYVQDAGDFTQETSVYTAVSDTDSHEFVGDFAVRQVISGSPAGPPWSSKFDPISGPGITKHYDITVQFTQTGQQAWVKMISHTETGSESWRNGTTVYGRNRDWATLYSGPSQERPF